MAILLFLLLGCIIIIIFKQIVAKNAVYNSLMHTTIIIIDEV